MANPFHLIWNLELNNEVKRFEKKNTAIKWIVQQQHIAMAWHMVVYYDGSIGPWLSIIYHYYLSKERKSE